MKAQGFKECMFSLMIMLEKYSMQVRLRLCMDLVDCEERTLQSNVNNIGFQVELLYHQVKPMTFFCL